MEIYGKLFQKSVPEELYRKDGTAVTNKDGVMVKMTFVIQKKTSGKKEKFVELQTYDRSLMNFIEDTSLGTPLRIRFDLESREWNGRWFTSATALEAEFYTSEKNPEMYLRDSSSRMTKREAEVDALYPSREKFSKETLADDDTDLPF